MVKKIISLALAMMVLVSMAVIGVSAADNKIYFEVPSDWKNYSTVFCHIWVYGGDSLARWQSKKEKCVDEGNGKWSYDLSKVGGLESGTYYGVIFSLDTGMQTYDTLMGAACIGDTLYSDGTIYENPQDSSKTAVAAFWRNHSASEYGPIMQITSIGNLIGTCLPPGITATDLFNSFLNDWIDSARTYSGKQDQQIIDDMANSLGLSQAKVEELIKASGIEIAWEKAKSDAPTADKPLNPAAAGTGQETTIVYIAVAMMIAAAAVVLVARKKKVNE